VSKQLKSVGIVSFFTIISRFLGVVREGCCLWLFGASGLISAFYVAFTLPNLFRRLLAEGSLTAAFVPTLQEELLVAQREGAFDLLSKVTSWLLVVTAVLVGLAMLVFGQAHRLPGHADRWYEAADLSTILFPYLVLISLAAAFSATLNVLHHFTEPALSPIWLNLTMIGSLVGAKYHFAHTKIAEMHWLCAGVLAGGVLQMGVPAAVLIKLGWRPRFDLALSPRVREIAMLMTPGIFGLAIYQINISVSRFLAFDLNDSAVTYLFSTNRLMEFPIGVFAIAVSTVFYPLIAGHAAKRDYAAMADDFRRGLRLILTINIPAGVGLALLSRPIVRLIYLHGHVTAADARNMAVLLALFAVGMPFFSIVNLTVRAFYAVKDTATPVRIALIDFVVNIVVSLSLMRWLGVIGLVVASTTAIIVQTILLERALAKKLPNMSLVSLIPTVGKILAATGVMAAMVVGGRHGLSLIGGSQRIADIVCLVILIPGAVAAYGAMLWLLKIDGWDELAAIVSRVRRGKAVPPDPASP
jgi:putative peptidoglycan lipid II flippase